MEVGTAKFYKAPFLEFTPHIILNDQEEKTGYMIKFLHVLQIFDNIINVTVIPNADQFWGAKINNSWNGLLGMLERNEGDFSASPMLLLGDRFNAFSTSHPFLISRTQILFGTKEKNENDIYSVVDKWIIVVLLCVPLLIYVTSKLNSKYGNAKLELRSMFLVQCLLGTTPQSFKCNGVTRFLSLLWCLGSFIVLVFVSSEMTSKFSSKLEVIPFNSVDDVFNFPNAKPLMAKNSAYSSLIQKSSMSKKAYAEILKRAQANPDSCYQSFDNVRENVDIHAAIENREKFSISSEILNWNVIKNRYNKTGNCKMKLSKPLMITYWVIYFKKNISQTLIKTVNKRLRQLTEGDCFEDLNPSLKNELHPCQKTETPEIFVVLNVSAFMVIFRICLLGFTASLITLILEIYVNTLRVNIMPP